jgi:hypothetical protein
VHALRELCQYESMQADNGHRPKKLKHYDSFRKMLWSYRLPFKCRVVVSVFGIPGRVCGLLWRRSGSNTQCRKCSASARRAASKPGFPQVAG